MNVKRGKFITVDGGDGAGKGTLLKALKDALEQEGRVVEVIESLRSSTLGPTFRTALFHRDPYDPTVAKMAELLTIFADRAQMLHELILPALERGDIVLCDRFSASSLAYQGYGGGLGQYPIAVLEKLTHGFCYPDLSLILDVTPSVGLARTRQRGVMDDFDRLDLEFHQRVRQGYLTLCEDNPQRYKRIDADQSPATVLQEALEYTRPLLAG